MKATTIVNDVEYVITNLKAGNFSFFFSLLLLTLWAMATEKIFYAPIHYFNHEEVFCSKVLDFYEDAFKDSEKLCQVLEKNLT